MRQIFMGSIVRRTVFWIEKLYAVCQKNPRATRHWQLLKIAVNVFTHLIYKINVHAKMTRRKITSVVNNKDVLLLRELARAKILQNCPDVNAISLLPVPATVKKFLLFNNENAEDLQATPKIRRQVFSRITTRRLLLPQVVVCLLR